MMFFSCVTALGLVWVWFFLPETSGKSLEALDAMFELPWHKIGMISPMKHAFVTLLTSNFRPIWSTAYQGYWWFVRSARQWRREGSRNVYGRRGCWKPDSEDARKGVKCCYMLKPYGYIATNHDQTIMISQKNFFIVPFLTCMQTLICFVLFNINASYVLCIRGTTG